MKPKFSVVVPVYNKANFVKQTIQSVLDQDFTDYELVLVNDGSTDGSLQILKAFDAPNITLLDQENQGLCAARNAGIQAAKGEIIALLDADDLWEPEHLQNLFELSQNSDLTWLGGRLSQFFDLTFVVKSKFQTALAPKNFST